jgi:DNA-binding IclR family transcriptional regulator
LEKKAVKRNQSVEKVFQIIEIMAKNKGAMRLQDIAQTLGMPASTALRFLNTLMEFGYVNQNTENSKYYLTMKICHIGDLVNSQISIRDIVKPYLTEVCERCKESVCLAIEEDMTVVYIDVVEGRDSVLKATQRIGKRAPMHCTGIGKLLLLNYDYEKLDRLIDERGLEAITPNTITSKEELFMELKNIYYRGYAVDDEECELGARCVAAPIMDYAGKIAACISVTGPISRMSYERLDEIGLIVKEVAEKISRQMGYGM